MTSKAARERHFRQKEKERKHFEKPMRSFIEALFQEYTELYQTLARNHPYTRNLAKTKTFRRWVETVRQEASAVDILSSVIRETLGQNETSNHPVEVLEVSKAVNQATEVSKAVNQATEVSKAVNQATEVPKAVNQAT